MGWAPGPSAWIDDMHHEEGLPLSPTTSTPGNLVFYDFGATYREAEIAAERRRFDKRKRAALRAAASRNATG